MKPAIQAGRPLDLVVGLFQAHDLAIPGPHRQKVDRPGAQGQIANMGAAVRDARVDVGVIEDFRYRLRIRAVGTVENSVRSSSSRARSSMASIGCFPVTAANSAIVSPSY